MRNLKVVPDLGAHHVHAAALTRDYEKHRITISRNDGTRITAFFINASPSLTNGFTVLRLDLIGTSMTLAVPDLTPVYVHTQEGP